MQVTAIMSSVTIFAENSYDKMMRHTVMALIASLFAMNTTALAQQNPMPGKDGNKYVPYEERTGNESIVCFTRSLTSEGLIRAYEQVSENIEGNIGVKLHTGEQNGPNIIPREWVRNLLQKDLPDAKIVETNTYYKGDRYTTEQHRKTLAVNGWTFCPVDIMDEEDTLTLPVYGGKWFKKMSVGSHMTDYNSLVVLTHFKGHTQGGFGGRFTGESGGQPRSVASPDINTEDFSAAVDYLATRDDVDADRIGILGICGFGGFAINAAAMDTRIKATVASTMYDICRGTANGYFDANDNADARYEMRKQLNAQRTKDYLDGAYKRTVMNPKPADDAPQFMKDYYDYYKTKRGYHPRSINSGLGWNVTSSLSLLNMPILAYSDEIRSAVLVVHGEKAHSRYFGEGAFKKLKGDNKELYIVPSACHTDLYDNLEKIPFDKIAEFYSQYLK